MGKCVDIMIEKIKGVNKIQRLRKLFEDDFNFYLKTIFGDRLMRFAMKHFSMNSNQYGSKRGQLCHSAILDKILTYDILRVTKQDGVYAEFDATENYDRMTLALVVLACSRLGLCPAPVKI